MEIDKSVSGRGNTIDENGTTNLPAATNGSANSPQPGPGRVRVKEIFLSVIIPAYNEAQRLPLSLERVLEFLRKQPYPSEIIIVDDGSDDDTAVVVERLIAANKPASDKQSGPAVSECSLRLVRNEHRGKAFAVRTGMLQGRGKYILFSDADFSTPIEETEKLLFWLDQGFDIAIGSREGQGARRYDEPFYRHLMGRVFNLLVRVVTRSELQDTQNGFKAFSRRASHDLFRQVQLYGANTRQIKGAMVTGFDVEVLFLARKKGYRIKEVPVRWYHVSGSKVNPVRDSVRMVKDILNVRLNDVRGLYKFPDNNQDH